jgi:uncharacterized protein YndB with AHSA1/START domain
MAAKYPGLHLASDHGSSIMKTTREVRFETIVRANREKVYDALATAEGLDGWFTVGTELESKPGGALIFRWKDWGVEKFTGEMRGTVVESRRPERFAFRWPVDSGAYQTTVTIDFQPHEEGCVVQLLEGIYDDDDAGTRDMLNRATGWAQALTLMKFWVEHGVTY